MKNKYFAKNSKFLDFWEFFLKTTEIIQKNPKMIKKNQMFLQINLKSFLFLRFFWKSTKSWKKLKKGKKNKLFGKKPQIFRVLDFLKINKILGKIQK